MSRQGRRRRQSERRQAEQRRQALPLALPFAAPAAAAVGSAVGSGRIVTLSQQSASRAVASYAGTAAALQAQQTRTAGQFTQPGTMVSPEKQYPAMPVISRKSPLLESMGAPGTAIFQGIITNDDYNPDFYWRDAVEIYDQMCRNDGQIMAIVQQLELPIRRATWTVEPFSEKPRDKEIASFIESCLFHDLVRTTADGLRVYQKWDDILRHVLMMLRYGFAVFEKVWREEDGWVKLAHLMPMLPMSVYRWWVGQDNELVGIQQYTFKDYTYRFVDIPAGKVLVFTHRMEGQNYQGFSLLRAAYKHWYYKDQFYKIDAIGLERNAIAVPAIHLPPSFTAEDVQTAQTILANLRANESMGVTLPPNWEIGYIAGSEHYAGHAMKSIEHHDVMIARSVLAQFLNLGSNETGTYALATDQRQDLLEALQAEAEYIEDVFSADLIPQLVDFNFADVEGYPRIKCSKLAQADIVELTDAISKLKARDANFLTPDPELEDWVRDMFGMPKASRSVIAGENPTAPTTPGRPNAQPGQASDHADAESAPVAGKKAPEANDGAPDSGGAADSGDAAQAHDSLAADTHLLAEALATIAGLDATERGLHAAELLDGASMTLMNPNHDAKGKFASGSSAGSGSAKASAAKTGKGKANGGRDAAQALDRGEIVHFQNTRAGSPTEGSHLLISMRPVNDREVALTQHMPEDILVGSRGGETRTVSRATAADLIRTHAHALEYRGSYANKAEARSTLAKDSQFRQTARENLEHGNASALARNPNADVRETDKQLAALKRMDREVGKAERAAANAEAGKATSVRMGKANKSPAEPKVKAEVTRTHTMRQGTNYAYKVHEVTVTHPDGTMQYLKIGAAEFPTRTAAKVEAIRVATRQKPSYEVAYHRANGGRAGRVESPKAHDQLAAVARFGGRLDAAALHTSLASAARENFQHRATLAGVKGSSKAALAARSEAQRGLRTTQQRIDTLRSQLDQLHSTPTTTASEPSHGMLLFNPNHQPSGPGGGEFAPGGGSGSGGGSAAASAKSGGKAKTATAKAATKKSSASTSKAAGASGKRSEGATEKPRASSRAKAKPAAAEEAKPQGEVAPHTMGSVGEALKSTGSETVHSIPMDSIHVGLNPREYFDKGGLEELANSIRENGLLQPISVRPHEGGYQVIAGERRLRAMQALGQTHVPAIVHNVGDEEARRLAILENLNRADMKPTETGRAYQSLLDHGMSVQDIGRQFGKSEAHVQQHLDLVNTLEPHLQGLVDSGKLHMGTVRGLASLSREGREEAADRILRGDLGVKSATSLIKTIHARENQLSLFGNPHLGRASGEARDRYLEAMSRVTDALGKIDDATMEAMAPSIASPFKESQRLGLMIKQLQRMQRTLDITGHAMDAGGGGLSEHGITATPRAALRTALTEALEAAYTLRELRLMVRRGQRASGGDTE